MNFEEADAKSLLRASGVAVPTGEVADSPQAAGSIVERLGPAAVKAQVPVGKRGKAGGIKLVDSADEALAAADSLLGMTIDGHVVRRLLVEKRVDIEKEYYAAVLNDVDSRAPLLLFSTEGGMDIEEIAADKPDSIIRIPAPIGTTLEVESIRERLAQAGLGGEADDVAAMLVALHGIYLKSDAELLEINPLARTRDQGLVALDCKLTVDDAALYRQGELATRGAAENLTDLERRGKELGLKYIELPGNVGVLANGAGLTMTTMDVIAHFGGEPANFLEIGGDAYTKATPALELVLGNPRVKSLIVNFCGAFARTDVMAEGVVKAWETLKPDVPVFFSVHGTGEEAAVELIRNRLGMEPFDLMEDAIRESVEAAG